MTPEVSVVIPTYNRAAWVGAAIDSALNQCGAAACEVIVVDDASTDATPQVLAVRAAGEPRLRVITRPRGARHGPAAARNAGIACATGTWIAFLDSDDTWEPDKLAVFLAAVSDDVVLVGSDYWIHGDDAAATRTMGQFLDQVMLPWWRGDPRIREVIPAEALAADRSRLADPHTVRRMTLGGFLWPQTSSVMVRRDAVVRVGGFDERLARTEDMDVWLKLLELGRWVYLDRPLAHYHTGGRDAGQGPRYRGHDPARCHTAYREMKAHLDFLRGLPRRFPFDPAAAAFWRDRIRAYHRYCAEAAVPGRPLAARWHTWRAGRG
jgi:glycosyltransferase involved in cell wall biosynthesis